VNSADTLPVQVALAHGVLVDRTGIGVGSTRSSRSGLRAVTMFVREKNLVRTRQVVDEVHPPARREALAATSSSTFHRSQRLIAQWKINRELSDD